MLSIGYVIKVSGESPLPTGENIVFIIISDYENPVAFFETQEQVDNFLERTNIETVNVFEVEQPDLDNLIRFDVFYHYPSDTWTWDFFPLSNEIGKNIKYDYDEVKVIRNDQYFFGVTLSAYDWKDALQKAKELKQAMV